MDAVKDDPPAPVKLSAWRILAFDDGSEILCGLLPARATLRMTSPIIWFSPPHRTIVTASGSLYELAGCPGTDVDSLFMRFQVGDPVSDVTERYSMAITRATH